MGMIRKIISGGQSGADIAGLSAAKMCSIPTGGTMPKGFMTELGPRDNWATMYDMNESKSKSYKLRTYQNVVDSDGTLIIGFLSPGTRVTLSFCKELSKPYKFVSMNGRRPDTDQVAIEVYDWIVANRIYIVNVAGNRESKNPGIFNFTTELICAVLLKDYQCQEDSISSPS